MSELLDIYGWTIVAGAVMATVLALIGAQISSREQAVQALVISQASSLGVVIALAVMAGVYGLDIDHAHGIPLLASLSVGGLSLAFCDKFISPSWPARNTYYVGIFGILLSVSYMITALVPALESHMSASFFGDLALISDSDAKILIAVGGLALILIIAFWRKITELTFDIAVFSDSLNARANPLIHYGFVALTILVLCLSIQFMGFLFSVTSLLVPALFFSRAARSFTSFTWLTALTGIGGASLGFLASLHHGRLPTVPAIAVAYIVIGAALAAVLSLASLVGRRS